MRKGEQGAAAVIIDAGQLLLIRENYDRRRYGLPGGTIEPGETPEDAVVREVLEETGLHVVVEHLIGSYGLKTGLTKVVFRCRIVSGAVSRPDPEEIAEIGWYPFDSLPRPLTNSLHYALPDIIGGTKDIVRDGLMPLT
jgi:8-oxo-dGTP diphosphatase